MPGLIVINRLHGRPIAPAITPGTHNAFGPAEPGGVDRSDRSSSGSVIGHINCEMIFREWRKTPGQLTIRIAVPFFRTPVLKTEATGSWVQHEIFPVTVATWLKQSGPRSVHGARNSAPPRSFVPDRYLLLIVGHKVSKSIRALKVKSEQHSGIIRCCCAPSVIPKNDDVCPIHRGGGAGGRGFGPDQRNRSQIHSDIGLSNNRWA